MRHGSEDYRLSSIPSFSADDLERLKRKLANLKNFSPDKSLSVVFPAVAAQLHPTLNGDITADMIPATYFAHFIWQCPVNLEEHIWKATVFARTAGSKNGCPFCKRRKVDSMSSLAVLRPDLVTEWNFEDNGRLGPDKVVPTSDLIVSWRCKNDSSHVWEAQIRQRNVGHLSCPYCSGKYVTDANRLSILFPEVSAEFHPKRNRMLYAAHEVNQDFYPQNERMPPEKRPARNRRLRASDLPFDTCEIVWWFCSKDSRHED